MISIARAVPDTQNLAVETPGAYYTVGMRSLVSTLYIRVYKNSLQEILLMQR